MQPSTTNPDIGRVWLVYLILYTLIFTVFAMDGSQPSSSHLPVNLPLMERTVEKITRYESHINFLQLCLRNKVLPNGLQPTFGFAALPRVTTLHDDISDCLLRASRHITVSVMNSYRNLVESERLQLHQCLYDLFQSADNSVFISIRNHLDSKTEYYREFFKRLKRKKFRQLKSCTATTQTCPPDRSNKQTDSKKKCRHPHRKRTPRTSPVNENPPKFVFNISFTTLKQEQVVMGPSFAPSPDLLTMMDSCQM